MPTAPDHLRRLAELLETTGSVPTFLSTVMDLTTDVVLVYDRLGQVVFANATGREYFARFDSSLTDSMARIRATGQFFDVPTGRRLDLEELPLARALRGEVVQRGEYLVSNVEGQSPFWLECVAHALRDSAGGIAGAVLLMRNISNAKEKDAEAASQRRLLDHVYDRSLAGVLRFGHDGHVIECNDAIVRMLGCRSREDVCSLSSDQLYFDASARERMLRDLEARGLLYEYEVCFRRQDGLPCWVLMNVSLFHPAAGPVDASLIATVVDITEHKLSEESVRQSEHRFAAFMRHLPGFAFIKDLAGRYVYYNEACAHFGRTAADMIGKTDHDIWPPEDAAAYRRTDLEVAASGRPAEVVESVRHLRGNRHIWLVYKFPIVENGNVAFTGGIGIDITERRQLEEKVSQGGKMQALGRLAGGVAHDFNNLLTLISGYGHLVKEGFGRAPETRMKSYVQEILKSAERAAGLTGQLLAFGRRQIAQPTVFDLRDLVRNLEKLLHRTIGEDVDLTVLCGSETCPVRVDLHQMEQAVMNLAVNARDAMPLGGTLAIECRRTEETPPCVLLVVADTGVGMDAATREHLFEPFFTSKERGRGTGLGLSTVYGVVSQAGGTVEVESEPGEGSVFRIRLRLDESVPVSLPVTTEAPPGTETILVVEDEPSLRKLVETMLAGLGYTVVVAESAAEAAELYAAGAPAIDLLLTDVIMPQTSGAQLAEQLRARHPALPVLFMSGYTDDVLASYGVLEGETQLIEKPFTFVRLACAIRAVLDAAGSLTDGMK